MENDYKNKHNQMIKIHSYERAIVELSTWHPGVLLSNSTSRLTGEISNEESRDIQINLLKIICADMEDVKKNNNKLYLTDIINLEKPEFTNNNLILSPTGSGKSYFISSLINCEDVLLLVSTTSLKDKLVPISENEREKLGNRMYSTKRKNVYGESKSHRILVMTYAEFGNKIKFTSSFANKYNQIFCDEIHSLFNYYKISNSDSLIGVIKYLFELKEGQEKYYFTATDEHLTRIQEESGDLFDNISTFNYLDHPDIVQNIAISSYKINSIEQVRPHLKAKLKGFKYFDYKVFSFCKAIKSQLYLEKVMIEEGFKPLVLWSVNNENYIMDEEQLRQREYVLRTGLIPDGYNSLIINSSMQEGWDLLDPKVKLVIMNTTNKTEFIQACGRVRDDIDVLVYRVNSEDVDYFIDFPTELIDVPLTIPERTKLAESYNLTNSNGRPLKWPSIRAILEKQGFIVDNSSMTINGERATVSIVRNAI